MNDAIKKTITYRLCSSLFGAIITLFLTGSIQISLMFICLELPIKTFAYYTFEKIWGKKNAR